MNTQTSPVDPQERMPLTGTTKPTSKIRHRARKFASTVRTGACFAWHVGLGTAVYLEQQTVKMAKNFARRGETFEAQTATELSERAKKARRAAANLGRRAQSRFGRVESLIDTGVNESLHMVGAPSRRDIDELRLMAKDLSQSISKLAEQEKQFSKAEQAREAAADTTQAGKPA